MREIKVVDTSFTIGVGPKTQFIAEEEMEAHLEKNGIDIQYVYQPDECFCHHTPEWNPYIGNDYVAKIQRLYEGRVRGLATVQVWHQQNVCNCGEEVCPYGIDHSRDVAKDELERCIIDLGLWGLRINPAQHNNPLNNRGICWPLLAKLDELQERCGRKLLVSVNGYGDHLFNLPEKMMDAAKQFPRLTFLLQHGAFVWGGHSLTHTAAAMDNVLVDLTTMPQIGIVESCYETYGIGKFCIGIDGPLGDNRIKMAIAADICADDKETDLLLGGNLISKLRIQSNGE